MTCARRVGADWRKHLLIGASAFVAAIGGAPAKAQEITEEDPLVVTGTRLVREDFEAISPITTIGARQVELNATLTADSLLNELPQVVPGNTRTSNNAGGEDFATVDLRGLGTNRTLVLINGERVPAASTFGSVDINTIPPALLSRVEVVTGGATAVYGSDAIAGVVNFVLKDDYEGAELNLTYGAELETGNAGEFEISGLVGGDLANRRGNLTAYASYYSRDGALQSEYDYSRVAGAACLAGGVTVVCDDVAEALANGWTTLFPGGAGTPPWSLIANDAANPFTNLSVLLPATFGAGATDTNCDGVPGGAVNSGQLSFNDAGQLTPRNNAGFCRIPERAAGSSRYNFAPDNFLIIPAERIALTTTGHYDFADNLRLNLLLSLINSRTNVRLAPSPTTGLVVTLTPGTQALIAGDHPDLWTALGSRGAPLAPFMIDRRFNEVGVRHGAYENNTLYFIAGLEGDLDENWEWSLSASYGQVVFNKHLSNGVNRAALAQGMAACQDASGAPLGAAALPGCILLDIYGPGTLTPAMIDFIRIDLFTVLTVEESRVTGFLRGDLFELPAGPAAAAFGFEYRDTFAAERHDNLQRSGNVLGLNAIKDLEGQIDVYELYAELALPLLSEVPLAHHLGLEFGYRRSNYSSAGNIDTYKIGGDWAPADWLRFRVIFNEATRAPNVFELFQAGDEGGTDYLDPCDDGAGNNTACIVAPGAAAINAAVYPGFAANDFTLAYSFGNPGLGPETAETLTYGVVIAPDWPMLRDFRMSIDYYNIEIADVIEQLGANFFLNDCYVNLNAASCARIDRDPLTGQVVSIDLTRSNQDSLTAEGYDIQLEWSFALGPGRLTINELYSILESRTLNDFEFAGTSAASVGTAFPDYKSALSVSYDMGDWTLFGRWTYVPEMDYEIVVGQTTPAASYIDASLRWNVTDSFTLTANADNILDEAPPQLLFPLQSNTDPQVYRVLGRTLTLSGRYRF